MTFWVAGAVVAGGIGGSLISANASGKAADAQENASNAATAEQRRQYDITRGDQLDILQRQRSEQAPYIAAGQSALAQLSKGAAPGGEFTKTYQRTPFEADPGYQFRLQQGEQSINRAAGAKGGLYSGATLKALSRFNSGQASQEYSNWDTRQNNQFNQFNSNRDFNRNNLATLAGIGQTATNAIGNAGQASGSIMANVGANTSNQIGQNIQNAGEARASGYVGQSNSIGSGIKQIANDYQQRQLLQDSGLQGGSLYNSFTNNAKSNGLGNSYTNLWDPAYG